VFFEPFESRVRYIRHNRFVLFVIDDPFEQFFFSSAFAEILQGAPSAEVVKMIHNGLKTLAAACDGARKTDGQGFNKFDSELGHRFAQKPKLSTEEALVGKAMLAKYRTQISAFDEQLALLV
jgi:hypothetical protein